MVRKRFSPKKAVKKKRALLVGLIVILLAAFLSLAGYRFYHHSIVGIWDGKEKISFAFQGESVFLVSLSPQGKSAGLLLIPSGTFLQLPHGYGSYRVESVYHLGELKGQGGRLLREGLQEYLGIPVEAFVFIKDSDLSFRDSEEIKENLSRLIRLAFAGRGETDFTRWDLARLWWLARKLKLSRVDVLDLAQTTVVDEVVLPDETKAKEMNLAKLDRVVQELFVDEQLRQENLSIAVLNGTAHAGLTFRISRLIGNIGGKVVSLDQGKETETCQIRSKIKDKESYTVRKLKAVFDCQWEGENLEGQRAEVVLIIGEDYWRKLTVGF